MFTGSVSIWEGVENEWQFNDLAVKRNISVLKYKEMQLKFQKNKKLMLNLQSIHKLVEKCVDSDISKRIDLI